MKRWIESSTPGKNSFVFGCHIVRSNEAGTLFCSKKAVSVECNDRDDYDFDFSGIFDQVWNNKQEKLTQAGYSL